MIGMIVKFSIAFIFSFILLSFQVNLKTIFNHLTEILGPVGVDVQESLKKSMKRGLNKSGDMSKEFFDNANPKFVDEINSQRSSLNQKDEEIILEKLEREDIKELDKVIYDNK